MSKKKKPVSRKGGRKKNRSLWITIGAVLFFLIAAVSILLYFEVHRERIEKWVAGAKDHSRERISSVALDVVMHRVDRYLDNLLKEHHVSRKNVRVHRSRKKGPEGTFLYKRIEVDLRRKETALLFREKLQQYVRKFPQALFLIRREITGKKERITLSLRVGDTIVRRIILVPLESAERTARESSGPRVAIIVDDIGGDLAPLKTLIDLDVPITFSVLPDLSHSAQAVRMITDHHRDLMLHLPMEPLDYPKHQPGEEALFVRMGEKEIRERVRKLLDQYPEIIGVNNHMGSRFTQDRDRMGVVLEEIERRNLFFVDSLTSGDSVAYREAKRLGVPTAKRNIFLDHVVRSDAVEKQIGRLIELAKKKGYAIAICHPHPVTLEALHNALGRFRAAGIEIVPVSELIDRS